MHARAMYARIRCAIARIISFTIFIINAYVVACARAFCRGHGGRHRRASGTMSGKPDPERATNKSIYAPSGSSSSSRE